jgi:hypothetical protein
MRVFARKRRLGPITRDEKLLIEAALQLHRETGQSAKDIRNQLVNWRMPTS